MKIFVQFFKIMTKPREMENISRGDFVTIRTEGTMQDVTVARLQSTRVQTSLSPSFKCNVLRESLSVDSKIFLAQQTYSLTKPNFRKTLPVGQLQRLSSYLEYFTCVCYLCTEVDFPGCLQATPQLTGRGHCCPDQMHTWRVES
jgi:hypothetical protein